MRPNAVSFLSYQILLPCCPEAGKFYTTTIPKKHSEWGLCYPSCHEIIGLHYATKMNGAQFFPSCSQVSIAGGSNFTSLSPATKAHGAKFPGGYKASDPGIYYVPNVSVASYMFISFKQFGV